MPECVLPDGNHPNKYIVCGEDLNFRAWTNSFYNSTYTELVNGESYIEIHPQNFSYIHITCKPFGGLDKWRCLLNIHDLEDFGDHPIIVEEDDRMSQVVTKCEEKFKNLYFDTEEKPKGYGEVKTDFEQKQLDKLQACLRKRKKVGAAFVDLCQ